MTAPAVPLRPLLEQLVAVAPGVPASVADELMRIVRGAYAAARVDAVQQICALAVADELAGIPVSSQRLIAHLDAVKRRADEGMPEYLQ